MCKKSSIVAEILKRPSGYQKIQFKETLTVYEIVKSEVNNKIRKAENKKSWSEDKIRPSENKFRKINE